jgi:hypothetical protein
MRADQVEASWDPAKSQWLIRIRIGEEVVRRHCKAPKDAEEQTLKSLVRTILQDEGYEPEPTELMIRR